MVNCKHCKSEDVTELYTTYSIPSYTTYKCNNCGVQFEICNNEQVPVIDLTKAKDQTKEALILCLRRLAEQGNIQHLDNMYNHVLTLNEVCYFQRDDGNEIIAVSIPQDLKLAAVDIYAKTQDLNIKIYNFLKEYKNEN